MKKKFNRCCGILRRKKVHIWLYKKILEGVWGIVWRERGYKQIPFGKITVIFKGKAAKF